ncbi:hypothetical protein BpHYR1_021491, partial [Brachionus plicatilis]
WSKEIYYLKLLIKSINQLDPVPKIFFIFESSPKKINAIEFKLNNKIKKFPKIDTLICLNVWLGGSLERQKVLFSALIIGYFYKIKRG